MNSAPTREWLWPDTTAASTAPAAHNSYGLKKPLTINIGGNTFMRMRLREKRRARCCKNGWRRAALAYALRLSNARRDLPKLTGGVCTILIRQGQPHGEGAALVQFRFDFDLPPMIP